MDTLVGIDVSVPVILVRANKEINLSWQGFNPFD